MYIYDKDIFTVIEKFKSSGREKFEITDVNNCYIQNGNMKYSIMEGYWSDAGTFDSLLRTGNLVKAHSNLRQENITLEVSK